MTFGDLRRSGVVLARRRCWVASGLHVELRHEAGEAQGWGLAWHESRRDSQRAREFYRELARLGAGDWERHHLLSAPTTWAGPGACGFGGSSPTEAGAVPGMGRVEGPAGGLRREGLPREGAGCGTRVGEAGTDASP